MRQSAFAHIFPPPLYIRVLERFGFVAAKVTEPARNVMANMASIADTSASVEARRSIFMAVVGMPDSGNLRSTSV
jgi:hypothetical protein